MNLTLQLKKQITRDWLKLFPEMVFYKPMWLMKRNGPLLVGVCLESVLGNTAYRPAIHIHNLCRPTGFISLTLWNPLLNKNSNGYENINLKFHNNLFENAGKNLRQQSIFPISEKLSLSEILLANERYLRLNMPSSKYPLYIYEDIISLLVWCNRRMQANQRLKEFINTMSGWSPTIFENVGGFDSFYNKLNSIIERPDKLMEVCESEVLLLKVYKLPDYGLICE